MTLFTKTVLRAAPILRAEFTSLSHEDVAAIFGNLGHESNGFAILQEVKPTVEGSAGGYGWPMWTGPRRRNFMAWCKKVKIEPHTFEANLGFLIEELKGPYRSALAAVGSKTSLRQKVIAFEMAYEKAGVKHYDSRLVWAQRALDALNSAPVAKPKAVKAVKNPAPTQPPDVEPIQPAPVKPAIQSQTYWAQVTTFISGAFVPVMGALNDVDWKVVTVLSVVGVTVGCAWLAYRHYERRARGVA